MKTKFNITETTDDVHVLDPIQIQEHIEYSKKELNQYAGVEPNFTEWDDDECTRYMDSQTVFFTGDINPTVSMDTGVDLDSIAINEETCIIYKVNHYDNTIFEIMASYPRWRDIVSFVATDQLNGGSLDHKWIEELECTGECEQTGLNRYTVWLGS